MKSGARNSRNPVRRAYIGGRILRFFIVLPPLLRPLIFCRLCLAAVVAFAEEKPASAPAPKAVEWTPAFYKNRHYVPVEQVAAYYRMKAPNKPKPGGEIALEGEKIRMRLASGQKRVLLNDWTFYLSYPVVELKGVPMMAAFDVRNVLDPIFRPHELRDPAVLKTVVLDPAGGGAQTGAKTPGGPTEKELTLEVAKLMRPGLEAAGFNVILTREKDVALSAAERVKKANAVKEEAVYVRLAAGSGAAKTKGFECSTLPPAGTPATDESDSPDIDRHFYPGNINDRESMALATLLRGGVVTTVKTMDLGVRRVRLDELRDVRLPAVNCLLGYLTNKEEAKNLADAEYRKKLAGALVDGVRRYAAYLRRGEEERAAEDAKRPLRFGQILMGEPVRDANGGERITLRVPVMSADGAEIDRSRVELQVFLFESVNGRELDLTTADPPAAEWLSVLPDWRDGQVEWMQVAYRRPPFTPEEVARYGVRATYGYVARLVYDGRLMDEAADPANLNRALHFFTPVFPRR